MKKSVIAIILFLLILSFWGVRIVLTQPHQFHGEILQTPRKAADIVMRSEAGPVRLSDFRGKIVLLYFGYTFCPDVCPTALANIKLAMNDLTPEEVEQVKVVFVSVDPARDTPESLEKYVSVFGDNFIGATGIRQEIDLFTTAFGASYKINAVSPDDKNYTVDHTAFVTVIDRNGYAVMKWAHGISFSDMGEDLKYLLHHDIPVSAQVLAGPTYTPVVCAVTLVPARVEGGEWLYQHHCAQCHGADLAGNPAWQTELSDGSHLAPPLNGSGRVWQYSEQDVIRTIKEGRNLDHPIFMPAFKTTLSDWEISFILTYVKSKWDINQLNYQHGFMTLTPQASATPAATSTPSVFPTATVTP